MPIAQQFICKKCGSLSTVLRFEKNENDLHYSRCEHCSAKNHVVMTGATPSQPGLLPVRSLLE